MHAGQFPLILVILQLVANRSGFAGLSNNNRALYKKYNFHQKITWKTDKPEKSTRCIN